MTRIVTVNFKGVPSKRPKRRGRPHGSMDTGRSHYTGVAVKLAKHVKAQLKAAGIKQPNHEAVERTINHLRSQEGWEWLEEDKYFFQTILNYLRKPVRWKRRKLLA
jgi:hypothetical protein